MILENATGRPDINMAWQTTIEMFAASLSRSFFFVQIGAHDGISGDPIHELVLRHRWSGLLVEPVREHFETLLSNYQGHENLLFENIAVSDRDEQRTLYRLPSGLPGAPGWSSQLASFFPEVIGSHARRVPRLHEHLLSEEVECRSLMSLLTKYQIEQVDLLCIDTEGFDDRIVYQIAELAAAPPLIYYEHKHLPGRQRRKCEQFLQSSGYVLEWTRCNTFARHAAVTLAPGPIDPGVDPGP